MPSWRERADSMTLAERVAYLEGFLTVRARADDLRGRPSGIGPMRAERTLEERVAYLESLVDARRAYRTRI